MLNAALQQDSVPYKGTLGALVPRMHDPSCGAALFHAFPLRQFLYFHWPACAKSLPEMGRTHARYHSHKNVTDTGNERSKGEHRCHY